MKKITIFLLTFLLFVGLINVNAQGNPGKQGGLTRETVGIEATVASALYCSGSSEQITVMFQPITANPPGVTTPISHHLIWVDLHDGNPPTSDIPSIIMPGLNNNYFTYTMNITGAITIWATADNWEGNPMISAPLDIAVNEHPELTLDPASFIGITCADDITALIDAASIEWAIDYGFIQPQITSWWELNSAIHGSATTESFATEPVNPFSTADFGNLPADTYTIDFYITVKDKYGSPATGCDASVSMDVDFVVLDPPTVELTTEETTICEVDVITLTATIDFPDDNGYPYSVTTVLLANGTQIDDHSQDIAAGGTIAPVVFVVDIAELIDAGTMEYGINNAFSVEVKISNLATNVNVFDLTCIADYILDVEVVQEPTEADAGTDMIQCDDDTFTMAANTPTVGTGSWSVDSGTATITDDEDPATTVTVPAGSSAVLLWTIENEPCEPSIAAITIVNIEQPEVVLTADLTSADYMVCEDQETFDVTAASDFMHSEFEFNATFELYINSELVYTSTPELVNPNDPITAVTYAVDVETLEMGPNDIEVILYVDFFNFPPVAVCTATDIITVTKRELPTVSVADTVGVCFRNFLPITATASGGNPDPTAGYIYTWTPPYSFIGSASGDTFTVNDNVPAGEYLIYVTASDGTCTSLPDSVLVIVRVLPNVQLDLRPNNIVCANIDSVELTGGTQVDPLNNPIPGGTFSYGIVIQEGQTVPAEIVQHGDKFYFKPHGVVDYYTIIYTFTDDYGCSRSATVRLTVVPVPVVEISPTQWRPCVDNLFQVNANLTTTGKPDYIYTWIPDGFTGEPLSDTTSNTSSSFVVNTSTPVAGKLFVYVTDDNGCISDMDSTNIVIYPNPKIDSLTLDMLPCPGQVAKLTAHIDSTGGITLQWYYYINDATLNPYDWILPFGSGRHTENTINIPSYNGPVLYSVDATSPYGCRDTAEFYLEPVLPPVIDVIIDPIPDFCNHNIINLNTTITLNPLVTVPTTQIYDWVMYYYSASEGCPGPGPQYPGAVCSSNNHGQYPPCSKIVPLNASSGTYKVDLPDDVTHVYFELTVNTVGYNCPEVGDQCAVVRPSIGTEIVGSGIDTICHGGSVEISYSLSHISTDPDNVVYYRWLENELYHEGAWQMHMLQPGSTQVSFTTYPALHDSEEGPASYCYQLEIWQGPFPEATDPLDPQFCHTFSDCHMVTVLKDPVATISGPITVNRNTESVEFTANVIGGYGEPTYTWYLNGELQDQTGIVFILDDQDVLGTIGHYDIAVKVKQSYPGCEAEMVIHYFDVVCATGNVTIVGPTEGCIGQSITLTAVIVTDVTDYTIKWKKDGQFLDDETGLTYTFIVEEPIDISEYQVYVSFCGCEVTIAPAHYFQAIPATVVWVDNYLICQNGAVEVEANHANWDGQIYRYLWYNSATALDPFDITYVNNRIFTYGELTGDVSTFYVKVEMLNAVCSSNLADFTITVQGSLEPVAITPATLITCVEAPAYFTVGMDPNAQLYGIPTVSWWVDGIEILGENLNYINIPFFEVGTHYVYARLVYPGNNCEYLTNQATVQVREIIDVTIDGPSVVCPSQIATLYAIVDPIDPEYTYTYQWYLNGDSIIGATSNSIHIDQLPSPIPYIYTVKVTDPASGCVKQAEPFAVEVVEFPVIAIAADKTKICVGEEVVIEANVTSNPNMIYQWYEGQTPLTGENAPILYIIPNNTTTYTFTATQIGSGCVATSNAITITVVETPEIQIAISVSNICEGAPVVLEATPNYAGVYTWYENGTIIQGAVTNKIIVFPKTQEGLITNYYYTAIVTVDPGCASEISNEVTVEVNPALDIFIDGNDIFCDNTNVLLYGNVLNYNQLTGPLNYTWIISGIEGIPVDTEPYLDGFAEGYYTQFDNLLADGFESGFAATHSGHPGNFTSILYNDNAVALACGVIGTGTTTLAMYNMGVTESETTGLDAAALAAQTAAAQFVANITDAILLQAQLDAKADAGMAGPYITDAEGMAKGYANANAMVTPLFQNSVINHVPSYSFNTFTATNAPNPTSGSYTPAAYPFVGTPCSQGITLQVNAYKAGFEYGYWSAYCELFPEAYYQELLDNVTALYIDEYMKIFDENYDMIIDVVTSGSFNPAVAGNQIIFDQLLPARNYPYRVYFTVTGENGCISTSEPFFVTVVAAPVVEITANHEAVCPGTEMILTANVIEQNPDPLQYQYQWFAEDTDSPIEGAIYPTYNVLQNAVGDYLYIVRVYHIDSECETFAQFNVSVQSLELDIDEVVDTICKGEQITFKADADQPDAVYTWFIGGVEVADANVETFTYKFNEAGVFVIEVSATSQAFGCISERLLAGTITVKDAPSVYIEGSTEVCNAEIPTELVAIVEPTEATVTYQWTVTHNGETEPLGTEPTQVVSNVPDPNPYIYVVEITDTESGCVVKALAHTVYVGQFAVIGITADKTEICPEETVTLTANVSEATNMIYQWYADEEVIDEADGPILYVNPAVTTVYTFTATEIGSECVATSNIVTVTVIPIPVFTMNPIFDTICQGEQVTFIALEDPTVEYTWFINGVEIEPTTLNALTYNFDSYGVFTVTVTATTKIAGCTSAEVLAGIITVKFAPSVVISGTNFGCNTQNPAELLAVVDPATATVTYQWKEDNLPLGTNQTQVISNIPRPIPYIYVVEITDIESGCVVQSLPHTVLVEQYPTIGIAADKTEICPGETVTITAGVSGDNNTTYQWYADNVAIDGATNPYIYVYPTETTVYSFIATQIGSECFATSNEVTVTVIPIPVVTVATPIVETICQYTQATTFVASVNTSEPVTYTWFIDNVVIPGATENTLTYLFADYGVFNISVRATTDVAECPSAVVYAGTITVKFAPTVSISGPDAICDATIPTYLFADVDPINATVTYQWYLNTDPIPGGTGAKQQIIPIPSSIPYNYKVEITDIESGCVVVSEVHQVMVNAYSQIGITSDKTVACFGASITFTADVEEYINWVYQWYQDGTALPGETDIILTIDPSTGTHIYSFIATQIGSGCTASSNEISITIHPIPKTPVLTISDNTICSGDPVIITGDVVGAYEWWRNGFSVAQGATNTITDQPTANNVLTTYNYQATVTLNGCISEFSNIVSVVVHPEISVVIDGAHDVCEQALEGEHLALHAIVTGKQPGVSYHYRWLYLQGNAPYEVFYEDNDNDFAVVPNHWPVNDLAAPYCIIVEVTANDYDCTAASDCHDVNIWAKPTVTIGVDNESICLGGTITATAYATPTPTPENPYNYIWTVNGITQVQNAPIIQITNGLHAGINDISVTIERAYASLSCFGSTTINVNVLSAPSVALTQNIEGLQLPGMCVGGQVNLMATVVDFDANLIDIADFKYEWRRNTDPVGDPNNNQYSEKLYQPGTYNYQVRAYLENNLGCNTEWTAFDPVKVVPQATVEINPKDYNYFDVCNGAVIEIANTLGITDPTIQIGKLYCWNDLPGDCQPFTNQIDLRTVEFNYNGQHSFFLNVEFMNPTCQAATSNVLVYNVVNNPVWESIFIDPKPEDGLCLGETVTLSAKFDGGVNSGTNIGTIQWMYSFEGGNPVNIGYVNGNQTHKPAQAGSYTYIATYIPTNPLSGCQLDAFVIDPIEVRKAPAAIFANETDLIACANDPKVELIVEFDGVPPFSFQILETPGGNVKNYISGTNIFTLPVAPTVTTQYTLIYVEDTYGCKADVRSDITVVVSDVKVLDSYVSTCEETVDVIFEIAYSVTKKATYTLVGETYVNQELKKLGNQYILTIDVSGLAAGEYPVLITIDDCEYPVIVNVGIPTHLSYEFTDDPVDLIICANDPSSIQRDIHVTFEGLPPFKYLFVGTDGTSREIISFKNEDIIKVSPAITTTYSIEFLVDASECVDPTAFEKHEIVVTVTDVEIITQEIVTCDDAIVNVDIRVISSLSDIASLTIGTNTYTHKVYPGANAIPIDLSGVDYGTHIVTLSIDGCDFTFTVTKHIGSGGGNATSLIHRRWEGYYDIVAVSNNYMNPESPYYNGGYEFTSYQWFKNGVLIPGATQQYYQDPNGVNGIYSVKLTGYKVDIYGNRISSIEFTTCDQEFNPSLTLKVYPVPAQVNQPVWVELDLTPAEMEGATLDVYDAKGAHVKHILVVSNKTQIDGFKAQGTYFGKITTGTNEIKAIKFVIVK